MRVDRAAASRLFQHLAARTRGVVFLVCLLCTNAVGAQTSLSNQAMRTTGDDPRGLPIETFVQKPLPVLAREMLLESHLDDNSDIPRPQRRGVQLELFAPGDFGVVVRYRW